MTVRGLTKELLLFAHKAFLNLFRSRQSQGEIGLSGTLAFVEVRAYEIEQDAVAPIVFHRLLDKEQRLMRIILYLVYDEHMQ